MKKLLVALGLVLGLFVSAHGQDYYRGLGGLGVGSSPSTVAAGPACRLVAQTAAVANVCTVTVGPADATFLVTPIVTLTTAGSANFTATVAFTDESNTARTQTWDWAVAPASFPTAVTVAGQYLGTVRPIRVKASTTIVVSTTGTFTGATYNVEASILKIG